MVDKRKQSIYLPTSILDEIMLEAKRLDRSLSWMIQQSWLLSRNQLQELPALEDMCREIGPREDSK